MKTPNDSIQLLLSMIEIHSPSEKEGELARFMVDSLKQEGFEAYVDEVGNAIGIFGSGKNEILLVSHLDTVGDFIPPRMEGDTIYGRGAVDSKASIVSFLSAASQLNELKDKKIVVAGVVQEENLTSIGARNLQKNFNPDFVIVGAPTGWQGVIIGYRGRLDYEYFDSYPLSHSVPPEREPVKKALDFFSALETHVHQSNSESMFNNVSLHIRSINTKEQHSNKEIEVQFSLRTPLDFERNRLEEYMKEMCKDSDLTCVREIPAVLTDRRNALVECFVKAIRKTGGRPGLKKKGGSSDMNVLRGSSKKGIVAYGPGDTSLSHTPNEHISIEEISKSVEVLKNVLREL